MATEAEIHAWLSGYERDWDQLCQALMWQMTNEFGTQTWAPASAIDAYWVEKNAGRIQGGTPQPGSFVYWDIGTYGHVGFMMNDGRILMASGNIREQWVWQDAGWQYLESYADITGARLLGWSWGNGGNTMPFTRDTDTAGGGNIPILPEENEMPTLYRTQNTKRRTIKNGGRQRFLNDAGTPLNLVGQVGRYQFVIHVQGEGLKAGEELDVLLIWHDVATGAESPHYIETIKGEGDGSKGFKRNFPFANDVLAGPKGTVVVAEMRARGGDVDITVTGSEALAFSF